MSIPTRQYCVPESWMVLKDLDYHSHLKLGSRAVSGQLWCWDADFGDACVKGSQTRTIINQGVKANWDHY